MKLKLILVFLIVRWTYGKQCPFNVMQLNVWNKEDGPNWTFRKHLISDLISETNPDCVAFEEVRISSSPSNPYSMFNDLKEELKNQLSAWEYQKASSLSDTLEEGIAIGCRFPFNDISRISLLPIPKCYDSLNRVILHTNVVLSKKDTIDVFVTHWSYAPCNQLKNSIESLQFINISSSNSNSVILLGDFNAYEETNPSLKLLETTPVKIGNGFYRLGDAWKSVHGSKQPGFTFSSLNSKDGLHNRCDRIFIGGGKTYAINATVICHTSTMQKEELEHQHESDSSTIFDLKNEEEPIHPSDHCALLVKIMIPCTIENDLSSDFNKESNNEEEDDDDDGSKETKTKFFTFSSIPDIHLTFMVFVTCLSICLYITLRNRFR